MKTIIIIILGVSYFLYTHGFSIELNPFKIQLNRWAGFLAWVFFIFAFVLHSYQLTVDTTKANTYKFIELLEVEFKELKSDE